MTTNVKNYNVVRTALSKLEAQVKAESKIDPRLVRGAKRISRMLAMLKIAQGKYELVHSRKVPAKLVARKAKAKAGGSKKRAAKKSNVVKLETKKAA